MTFGNYNPRRRYVERDKKRNARLLRGLIVLVVCCGIAFWLGRQHSSFQINSFRKEADELRIQVTALQKEVTGLRAEKQTAASRYDQLRQQYDQELPGTGPIRQLLELVRTQIAEGMSAERMSFIIRSARPPRNCADPASKRFMVKTPAYTGPDSSATFGDGVVTISGIGASSRNQKGEPQAWFDASQPVTLSFLSKDGTEEKKSGVLPIQHSLIAGGREFRFTLADGEKSFIKVTYDSCEYP